MSQKRKAPESKSPAATLAEQERALYTVIRSKGDMGIWTLHMKKETGFNDNVVGKCLKSLLAKKMIKEVTSIQNKKHKHFMASEFEPAKEISGGAWYVEGSLDTEFINVLKDHCTKLIMKQRVATLEGLMEAIRRSGVFTVDFTSQQIEEIVTALVLDDEVVEVKSNGMGEFERVPVGKVCYKCTRKGGKGEPRRGAMASIPCGVCPVISLCSPDGIISPKTCKYYSDWLNF